MEILKKDMKKGLIKIKANSPEDAWKLEGLLEEGDMISGRTLRSMEILKGDKKEKTKKKQVFVKIELEKKEFHEYTGKLRLMGKITEGPEDTIGSYHTFKFSEGKSITIEKEWKKWQLKRLEKSMIKQPKILACVMDEREAVFSELGESIRKLAEIENSSPGKQFGDGNPKKYYAEIYNYLKNKSEKYQKIILAGPGFAKDSVYKIMKEKEPEACKKIKTASSSNTGETGVQEIIKNGALEKVVKDSRINEETKIIENFLGELGKESGKVTYGIKEVENAIEIGAAERVIVCEKNLREYEKIMETAEKNGAEVFIISESHESGMKLSRMGGIAAFLRFRID